MRNHASAALALIEGALLLARVSGQANHLAHAKHAAASSSHRLPVPPWNLRRHVSDCDAKGAMSGI